MGFARMGSNPIGVEVLTFYKVFGKLHVHPMEQIRWSNGVTVSTLDFESSDGGSNPPWTFSEQTFHTHISRGETTQTQLCASLAQLVARRSHNPKVVSSILTGGIFVFLLLSRQLHC